MDRKLGVLSLVFIALLGVGAYLWMFGKPSAPRENPLKKVDMSKISRLVITNAGVTTRLEKQNGVWNITAPIPDVADPSIPKDILGSLEDFTLGSVVSENPSRYGEFQLDPAGAARIDAYLEGREKPVLSGFVGKTSNGYENCYFRFAESSGPVYLANGLQQFQFRRDAGSFRWTSLLGLPSDEPTHLHLVSGQKSWDLSRSSNTWTTSSGKTISPEQIFGLIKNIRDLNASSFGSGTETPAALGFDAPATPYLVLSVDDNGVSTVLTVGKPTPTTMPHQLPSRYARSSHRSAVFIVQEAVVKQLVDAFSKLPK
jgi:hypothetical protein